MAYQLGAVKSHVATAANYFGTKHGYKVIYGWRAVGSVPNSDHPKGLALDFMGSNKAKGDALVSDLIGSASQWNITYIIWYRRIWSREQGWKSYGGPSAHTNHVHVSFSGNDAGNVVTTPTANPLVPDSVESLMQKLQWITEPGNWARIIVFGVGFIIGLFMVIRVSGIAGKIKEVL